MRLKNLITIMAAVGVIAGCLTQNAKAATAGGQRAEGGDQKSEGGLLMRVQFAGTTALLANTNAAYLTNFAALPETAALGTQIVAKVSGLPGRLVRQRGAGSGEREAENQQGGGTNIQHSTSNVQHSNGGGAESKIEQGAGSGERGAEGEADSAKGEHRTSNIEHPTSNDPSTNGAHGVTRPTGGELLQPVLAQMLRDGFILELRGDKEVTEFALAAKADAETAKRWEASWKAAATNWFKTTAQESPHPNPTHESLRQPTPAPSQEGNSNAGRSRNPAPLQGAGGGFKGTNRGVSPAVASRPFGRGEGGWSAGEGRIMAKLFGGWFLVAGSKTDASAALAAIQKSVEGAGLEAGAVLQGELSSILIPGPVQRSVYGGFEGFKITVTPDDQSMKVRGKATYAKDLPKLGPPPAVPTNLVTEATVSFTMVREPGAWLEPDSVLRRFLPNPVPDTAWFWGGEGSPYQFFMAVPFAGREVFNNEFGPTLVNELQPLASFIGTANVVLDTNEVAIHWRGTPFVLPRVYFKDSGTNHFVMAETFPQGDFPPGLTPALIGRVTNRTNLVLFDWEYITLRFDTWFRIGSLAMLCGNYEQVLGRTPSLNMIQKFQLQMRESGNTTTEILQTGPQELTLARRGPLAFTSIELFWLANWLESANFPAANFLVPVEE